MRGFIIFLMLLVKYSVIKLRAPTNVSPAEWQQTYTFLWELSCPSFERGRANMGIRMALVLRMNTMSAAKKLHGK